MHGGHEMRRPGDATAAAIVVLLLWLAALTFAFQGCAGGFLRRGGGSLPAVQRNSGSVSLGRKMLLAVESTTIDTSSAAGPDQQRHHRHHHHHHGHRAHRHRQHSKWNWLGIPPSAAAAGPGDGKEIDPRYGVEKRLVPTGPNPLHH